MAVVSSIDAGSKPTAAQMNALWSEFDCKLTRILYGKTFLLSRPGQFPANIMGKIFFFTPASFNPIYAQRAPGIGVTMGGVVLGPDGNPLPPTDDSVPPYDHSFFAARVTAIQADITANPSHATWDDINRIVTVPLTPDSAYGIYPHELTDGFGDRPMGFFDHSLQAHYIMHQTAGDTEPHKYYIREHGAVPEKQYKLALAELVIEGQNTLTIPDTYDKYNCFRIHNCSAFPCTVSFGTHYSVTVGPFGCSTVRRDSVSENYRRGWNYSFKYEKGDPRMFWFHCTQQDPSQLAYPKIGGSTQMRVSNSMSANNLCNPAMIYDWIGAMAFTESWMTLYSASYSSVWGSMDPGNGDIRYAWFLRDASEIYDAYDENKKQFGDPSNPATLIGDLIHHPGTIIIARTDRTTIDPATGKLQVTWDTMQFRGYKTIVADFAAHGITMAENADGDLTLANANADICDLIPIGTNLFKSWVPGTLEYLPQVVPLHDTWDQNAPLGNTFKVTIENNILECPPAHLSPDPFALGNQAQAAVFRRTLQETANTGLWHDYDSLADRVGHDVSVTGPTIKRITGPYPPAATPVLHGIHKLTVADLLTLKWWGNPALADQSNPPYVTFDNKALTLTDQGLVLTFDCTISGIEPAQDNANALSGDHLYWNCGILKRTQVITFRGHGWGHQAYGSKSMAFLAPRAGKRVIMAYITNEISGPEGADWGVVHVGSGETQAKYLHRVKLSDLGLPSKVSRFWRNSGRGIDVFLKNGQSGGWWSTVHSPPSGTPDYNAGRYIDYFGNAHLNTMTNSDVFLLPLFSEHYNGMAAAVNSLKTGYGLTCAALAWRVNGKIMSLAPTQDTIPVPLDCFASFPGGDSDMSFGNGNADTLALAQFLGLPIKTDLPAGVSTMTATPQTALVRFLGEIDTTITGSGTYTGTIDDGGVSWKTDTFTGSVSYSWSASMAQVWLDPGARAVGQAPGSALGSWNPTSGRPSTAGINLGDYYVCSAAGWDGGEFWMKGDLLAWQGRQDFVFDPNPEYVPVWDHISANAGQQGSAVVAQTGLGVQLSPEMPAPGFGHCCSARSLGTWTPPTLPAAAAAPGDFYTIASTVRPSYFAGSKIVWDGTQWQIGNSSYTDYHWISITDVSALMASLGFEMVFNQVVIPLNLAMESSTGAQGPSRLSESGSVGWGTDMSRRFDYAGQSGWDGWIQQLCTDSEIHGPCVKFVAGAGGARYQFSLATDESAAWKLVCNPYSIMGSQMADIKNFSTAPPLFTMWEWVFGGCLEGMTETYDPTAAHPETWSIGGNPNEPDAPEWSWSGWSVFGNMAPSGNGAILQGGINSSVPWQLVGYALLAANSEGTNPASVFTIASIGLWGQDGDWWTASGWNGTKAVRYGAEPCKFFGAAGSVVAVTPSNGLTPLMAPSGNGANLLFNINVNAISL